MSFVFIHCAHISLISLSVVFLYICYCCILYIVYQYLTYVVKCCSSNVAAQMSQLKMSVPPMRGHLQCRDTFAWIQECALKRGTTVYHFANICNKI